MLLAFYLDRVQSNFTNVRINSIVMYILRKKCHLITYPPHRNSVGNTCVCKHGVAQLGVYCPVNGAANCLSCNTGFTINSDNTECIRTFGHSNIH